MKKSTNKWMKTMAGVVLAAVILLISSCGTKAQPKDESRATVSNVKAPDIDLHAAVITNNMDAVKQHIAAGSDLNVRDPFGGSSPLITASLFGNVEAVKLLIAAGAEVNVTNNEGSTALHTASFFCYPEVVKILLAKGADKSIKNKYGSTALESIVVPYENVEGIYKMMGKQFAPMGLKLDFARIEKTRPEIAELLK